MRLEFDAPVGRLKELLAEKTLELRQSYVGAHEDDRQLVAPEALDHHPIGPLAPPPGVHLVLRLLAHLGRLPLVARVLPRLAQSGALVPLLSLLLAVLLLLRLSRGRWRRS